MGLEIGHCPPSTSAAHESTPTQSGAGASITLEQKNPEKANSLLRRTTCMADLYKSADTIPESGIYRVVHAPHRLPHEVTLIGGQTFPPCAQCHEDVRFELVRELPELERQRRGHVSLYSLPVLDDEDKSGT